MKTFIIFWEGPEGSIKFEEIKNILGIEKLIVMRNYSVSEAKIKNQDKIRKQDDFIILDKKELLDYPRAHSYIDNHTINEYVNNDATLYKVVHRHYSMIGLRPTLKLIEDSIYNSVAHALHFIDYNLDGILFFVTPHYPIDYVFWKLAVINSKKVYVSKFMVAPHLEGHTRRRLITNNFPYLDDSVIDGLKNYANFGELSVPVDLMEYINEYRLPESTIVKYNNNHLGTRKTFGLKLIFEFIISIVNSFSLNRGYPIWLKIRNQIKFYFFYDLINFRLKKYYSKISESNPDLKCTYVYFPLQYQPEASTIPLGGTYSNQSIIIDNLLSKLGTNQYLYLREHPAYWHRKNTYETMDYSRSVAFYEKYLNYSNRILFISHKYNHYKLINNSMFVVTVTGTVALESLAKDKKCIFYGEYFYNDLPNIIRPDVDEPQLRITKTTTQMLKVKISISK